MTWENIPYDSGSQPDPGRVGDGADTVPGRNPGPRWRAVPEHPEPHYPDHARRPDSAHARHHDPRPARQLHAWDVGPDPGRAVPAGPGPPPGKLNLHARDAGGSAPAADDPVDRATRTTR